MKIVLMGNPNVGKSALFSRLTGVEVVISNYAGTTVEYKKGIMKLGKEKAEIIDVPGTYSLEASSEAEEIAVHVFTMICCQPKAKTVRENCRTVVSGQTVLIIVE